MSEMAVGFMLGIVSGLLTNVLWAQRARLRFLMTRRGERNFSVLSFDPRTVGLFPMNRWTPSRQLTRDRLVVEVATDRPPQKWFDEDEWSELRDQFATNKSGHVCYVVDYEVDHRESERGEAFRLVLAPADYAEHLATAAYLKHHPEVRSRIQAEFVAGRMDEFARTSPPSSVKVNVAVVNLAGEFLAVERSGAVETKRGIWTVGPNETMQLPPRPVPGSAPENLFSLAERCLREELGLEPFDYSPVIISWIGYDVTTAQVKVYAQVRTHLTPGDILERMTTAHGAYEADSICWMPVNRGVLNDLVENWKTGDSEGRVWSASAPLALQEMWRMRKCLRLDP